MTPLDCARTLSAWGLSVIPIRFRDKAPHLPGWQNLRLTEADLPQYFNGQPQNIGVLLGDPSHGATDIDLDAPEAVVVARRLLPRTLTFGRAGKRTSHYLFWSKGVATEKWIDPDGTMLVELRSTGCQTIFPGSCHPSGEPIAFDEPLVEMATVDPNVLRSKVSLVGAAALLSRRWPPRGRRHDAALALAGGLLRAGWDTDVAAHFVETVALTANDEEAAKRGADVYSTATQLSAEAPATGWPRLSAIMGEVVVSKARNWLGIEDHDPGVGAWAVPVSLAERTWPVLDPVALYGPAGAFVNAIAPHTEGDPVAVLLQFLAAFGNAVGRGPHFLVEADEHHVNLFIALVGKTSKGRKGTSWGHPRRAVEQADPSWAKRVVSGLSSGEGLIWQVRDAIYRYDAKKDDEVLEDPGIDDKRLMVVEPEFARALKVLGRDGNTLSAVLRDAWDRGRLQSLTKNSPAEATAAHVSIVGHITEEELKRSLDATEIANGFANRFLFACVKRSQCLPDGGTLTPAQLSSLSSLISQPLQAAKSVGRLDRTDAARSLWHQVYPALSEGRPGLVGAVISRAEAQVTRLACLYALLDCSTAVDLPHLEAALALWRYCEDSARYIFGNSLGNPLADRILAGLRVRPDGMTRSEISAALGRHAKSNAIDGALATLAEAGLATPVTVATGGRPSERWVLAAKEANEAKEGGQSDVPPDATTPIEDAP